MPVLHDKWKKFVKECQDCHALPCDVNGALTPDVSMLIRVKLILVPYMRSASNDSKDDSGATMQLSVDDNFWQALAPHLLRAAGWKRPVRLFDFGGVRTHTKSAHFMYGSIPLHF